MRALQERRVSLRFHWEEPRTCSEVLFTGVLESLVGHGFRSGRLNEKSGDRRGLEIDQLTVAMTRRLGHRSRPKLGGMYLVSILSMQLIALVGYSDAWCRAC